MSVPPDTAALWAALPLPALLIDANDRIEELNPAAEAFLNTSSKAARGAPLWNKLAPDTEMATPVARLRQTLSPLFVTGVTLSAGARGRVACDVQIAPMAGGDASLLVLVSPRESPGLTGPHAAATSAAKSAIGMAEMLAHEIKNPLAGITGAAQLLSMNLDGGESELTDLIVAESRRIVKLLEQVEQFGNLSPPARDPVNLHDVLGRACRSALLGFGAKMRICEEFDPSLPPARGDADQLVQVALNLLKNAAEAAGPDGGTIRLRTYYDHAMRLRHRDGGGESLPLQIEVIDDGPGIPPDLIDDIFDPFVSGRPNGTGLGLALVSKIVADHGGWISVTSAPGRTVVRISLALAGSKGEG